MKTVLAIDQSTQGTKAPRAPQGRTDRSSTGGDISPMTSMRSGKTCFLSPVSAWERMPRA